MERLGLLSMRSWCLPYAAMLGARFRLLLQYRTAAVAGVFTQIIFGWINVMVYQAFFRSSSMEQPMELADVITYIWLGQALFAMIPWSADGDVRGLVRSGGVAYELLRPVDLYALWFARAVALKSAPTMLRAVPLAVIAGLFFGLEMPASIGAGVWFALSVVGALLLSCAIIQLISISLLWTISGEGMTHVLPALVAVFSGAILPLPFFPETMQTVLAWLPFRGLVDGPMRIYVGHIPVEEAWWVLLHQGVWIGVLVLIGRWLLSRGVKKLVVQGG